MLYCKSLPYIPKEIKTKLISRHYDDPLNNHLGVDKIWELIDQKCYWLSFCHNVEAYVTGCNICLALKAVRYKSYGDLQLLPVIMYWWKNLSIDFVPQWPIFTNWKDDTYKLILVIVDQLINIIHYESIKIIIDDSSLAQNILDM